MGKENPKWSTAVILEIHKQVYISHFCTDFYRASYASTVLAVIVCLSVCLSVRPSVRHKSELYKYD